MLYALIGGKGGRTLGAAARREGGFRGRLGGGLRLGVSAGPVVAQGAEAEVEKAARDEQVQRRSPEAPARHQHHAGDDQVDAESDLDDGLADGGAHLVGFAGRIAFLGGPYEARLDAEERLQHRPRRVDHERHPQTQGERHQQQAFQLETFRVPLADGVEGEKRHHDQEEANPERLVRGGYGGFPTMGGFDQMTAKLGGFWDSMLGEGRRWWITANSDSHKHYSEGGVDFWPGEYSKTYVFAEKNHDSILAGLRAGRVFVTTGDLVSELFVEVTQGSHSGAIGEEVSVPLGSEITVSIRVRDPDRVNQGGENVEVNRIDLIIGQVTGRVSDPTIDINGSTQVVHRFTSSEWNREGEYLTMSRTVPVNGPLYVRVRGTNTNEREPEKDPPAEDPWHDLWFYSNPVFVTTRH